MGASAPGSQVIDKDLYRFCRFKVLRDVLICELDPHQHALPAFRLHHSRKDLLQLVTRALIITECKLNKIARGKAVRQFVDEFLNVFGHGAKVSIYGKRSEYRLEAVFS